MNGDPRCRTRRARQTGTDVTVAHADAVGLEHAPEYGLAWYSICEAHGSCVGHSTKRLAEYHAVDPAGWCEECYAALDPTSTTDPNDLDHQHKETNS